MISDRKSQSWRYCLSGQMSNHSIYLEKHMIFAALLDRVLEIPSSRFDYENDRVTDIDRINPCLGRSVVVSFDQCKEMDKKKKRGILNQSPRHLFRKADDISEFDVGKAVDLISVYCSQER